MNVAEQLRAALDRAPYPIEPLLLGVLFGAAGHIVGVPILGVFALVIGLVTCSPSSGGER
jgi:hypothetical protein